MHDRIAYQGITFDDVLLEPAYSDVVPSDVDVRTQLTRTSASISPSSPRRWTRSPKASWPSPWPRKAASASFTRTCHRPTRPARWTRSSAARTASSPIPITLPPDETVGTARRIMEQHNISGVPITVNGYLKGILTRRDLRFLTDNDQQLSEVMTKDNLVTAPENTTLEAAERILTENKVEKLLLVDENYKLKGLITIKDIDKLTNFPNACKDQPRPAARRRGGRAFTTSNGPNR